MPALCWRRGSGGTDRGGRRLVHFNSSRVDENADFGGNRITTSLCAPGLLPPSLRSPLAPSRPSRVPTVVARCPYLPLPARAATRGGPAR